MLDAMEGLVKGFKRGRDTSMIRWVLTQIETRVHCTTLSNFGVSGYSQSTVCGLYFHLNRVLLIIVYKGNNLVWLLDAINGHARLAVPGADL
jgi:hypothetical protein